MTGEEIKEILDLHKKWLDGEEGGVRANLSEAYLRGADLHGANLRKADLSGANLIGADLCRANLVGANLIGAELCIAYLCGADLREADMSEAILVGANLLEADLMEANLSRAYLHGAKLHGANLHGAKNLEKAVDFFCPMRCPETGSFTAYKKAVMGNLYEFVIIQLTIPASAKRSSATGEKCRASQAKVEKFYDLKGKVLDIEQVFSIHDTEFVYKIGKTVKPTKPFCEDRWDECASGIHFYMNFDEAVRY